MTNFLPADYEKPTSGTSKFLKLVKGDTRLRIISSPVMGWLDWDKSGDNPKPVRTTERQDPLGEEKPKHFWALTVLHDNEVKVLEITQASIQEALINYSKDSDWGDPREYDITITRTGEKMETKYTVIAKPKTELTEEQKTAIMSTPVNLEALLTGGDPFEA